MAPMVAIGQLFHQDNALAHTHPQWSSVATKMDSSLSITTPDDVINAVDHFLRVQDGAFCTERIYLLHGHWTKCFEGTVVIWKMIVWFSKRTPKFSWSMLPQKQISYL